MMTEWEKEEKLLLAMSLARVDKVTCASSHPCSILEEIGPWCGVGKRKLVLSEETEGNYLMMARSCCRSW